MKISPDIYTRQSEKDLAVQNRIRHQGALALAAVLSLWACGARAADKPASWPCWRGAGSQGIAAAQAVPHAWLTNPRPAWEATLGIGWSSPIVAEGKVFITDRQGGAERVLAFDAASGKEIWRRTDPVDFDPHAVGARHGNGPKSTPAFWHGNVYSLGIAGRLQCLNAAGGKQVWEVNFPARFGKHQPLPGGRAFVDGTQSVVVPVGEGEGAPVPLFGYTGSVLVAGGLVVTSVGGAHAGTIMAFNAQMGKEVWRALRDEVSYSSPVAATLAGIEQVVVMTGPDVVGLELRSGRKLWSHPFQIQYNESIGTPAIADPYVIVTGDGHPLTALKISRDGGGCSLEVGWKNRDLSSYLSSLLIHQGHVYGMNDGGEFGCVRLSDGKTVWIDGRHGFYCTPLLAGSELLCLNEKCNLLLLSATPKSYQPLIEAQLADRAAWTSPALAGKWLYIRADERLMAFKMR